MHTLILAQRRARALHLALAWLVLALQRQRTRRDLANLSDAALRDIGVSRLDALRESARPFWR